MSRDLYDPPFEGHARPGPEASGLVRAALEISARRRDTLARLKEALANHDDGEAIRLARIYTGLEDEACDRTDQGVH